MIHIPTLDRLLEAVSSVFDAYSVVLFCKDGNVFQLASSFSLGDSIRQDLRIEPGYGLVGWILKNNKPLLVEKFDQKNNFLGYYPEGQEEQVRVFLGCPLPDGKGALCMDSKKTYAFTDKDQRVLALFARVVGALLTDVNASETNRTEQTLYRCLQDVYALRENFPRWTDFLNSYLSLLAVATGYEYAFLVVSDEWGHNYLLEGCNKPLVPGNVLNNQTFSTGSGLLGWVFKKNQPVFFGDGKSELGRTPLFGRDVPGPALNTLLAFPLKVHKRCRGVLVFGDRESWVISNELRDFARMTADYLALFLENLYLKNKLRNASQPGVQAQCDDFDQSDSDNPDISE